MDLRSSKKEGFFRRRIARPILELLRQGVTPEKMALSLALGVAIGVFPALGTTTALCALVAFIWRLNLPAIQIVNYFVYPAQLALIIPSFRAGEILFGAPLAALGFAGCGHGSSEFMGLDTLFVDDDLARHGCVVLGSTYLCGSGLSAASADLAACSEADGNGKSDRLKSVPLQRGNSARECRGPLRSV